MAEAVEKWLHLVPKNRPRICDLCGRRYSRRNLVEGWDTQNPGHRVGWSKTRLRVCLKCANPERTRRMLLVATVRRAK